MCPRISTWYRNFIPKWICSFHHASTVYVISILREKKVTFMIILAEKIILFVEKSISVHWKFADVMNLIFFQISEHIYYFIFFLSLKELFSYPFAKIGWKSITIPLTTECFQLFVSRHCHQCKSFRWRRERGCKNFPCHT